MAITMRTPGHDFELAAGYLATEGIVGSPSEIRAVRYCTLDGAEQLYNVVTVDLSEDLGDEERTRSYANSSCGVCGKTSLDEIGVRCAPLPAGPTIGAVTVLSLPSTLAATQKVFAKTGGLHAAGLFDASGTLIATREDVGRHNTVDKLVGHCLLQGRWPLGNTILMVSGRAGFEIVQKAAVVGITIVCAVSAPSSLAVAAAEELGVTLAGFVRDGHFNVYAHPERIAES